MKASVLILGGGFAGLTAVHSLDRLRRSNLDLEIRMIDRSPHSVFSPLLPDLISSRVRGKSLHADLAGHCYRAGGTFLHADLKQIDPESRTVVTDCGEFSADVLLCCFGCDTNFFGMDQARENSIGLKDVSEGLAIGREAMEKIDRAVQDDLQAQFLVVGGGYTGFEVASHLAHLGSQRTGLDFDELHKRMRIRVVEKADRVLRNIPEELVDWAVGEVEGFGVEIITGQTIDRFGESEVTLTDGTIVEDPLICWCAGVTPGPAAEGLQEDQEKKGRLPVDENLRVKGYDRVFAAGDLAAATRPGEDRPLRMSVQFSLMGGRHIAEAAVRTLTGREIRVFNPADPGYVVPLAPGKAAGSVLGRKMKGTTPFLLHYVMSLYRSWSWRQRKRIISDLLFRRGQE
ncbi:MAG: NAD(P)/FAD-dependent oxidoreductase [Phycisphaerae bacterium]